MLIDGEPWFAVSDVCDVLGYTNSRKAVADHCRAGGVTKRDTPTSSGIQPLTYINEGNLYRLVIKSRKPEAERFEAWVCDEVLPAIRKTGRYQVEALAPVPDYERCTNAQQQELATAMSRAFGYGVFGQEGTQHGFNRLRLNHRLHNIADLPAADFERAMATVGEIAAMNLAFVIWLSELKKVYRAEYVEAGGPWTLWLKREWKKQMGTALPPRPDWLDVQKKLGLFPG